ncbi:hypothetical protein ACN9MU_16565 [Pseudoduganella sp. R-32]|uniref:hypothetical protein n=1 Tax=Pseudoduganella sp. R-32 TaxID=3404061 RepID=UPI003CEE6675
MANKPNGRGGARPGAGRKPNARPDEIKRDKIQTLATPSKRGGVRVGAGRKPKATETQISKGVAVKTYPEPQSNGSAPKRSKSEPSPIRECDMLTLLKDIALGRTEATHMQVRAAIAAVQYTHAKKNPESKKQAAEEAAKAAAKGRFASSRPPPKLVYSKKEK